MFKELKRWWNFKHVPAQAALESEYVWLTEFSKIFLERDYLVNGQTVDNRVNVICNTAEKILKRNGFAQAFKNNLKKGWYSLSSPIWNNFGNARGMPISCFGSHISDSCESISNTWREVFMMTKYGGGTSAYFGDVRERGAAITDNGESSGSVHFMQLFDNLIKIVSQGSSRRGQFAAYLPIDHPDIEEFLTLRSEGSPIQDLSFGVCVSDAWMEAMIAGDKDKRKVWAKVLESRTNFGYPYIFFTDNANKTVEVYKDKGMKIRHSNLCVTGDQRVVTDRGLKTVKELYEEGGKLRLFDNEKIVSASPMKLIEKNADVYQIVTKNGRTHTVTGYHKVKTDKGAIRALELVEGDKIAIQNQEGLFGNEKTKGTPWKSSFYEQILFLISKIKINDNTNTCSISINNYSQKDIDELRNFQIILSNIGTNSKITYSLLDGIPIVSLVICENSPYDEVDYVKYVGKQDVYCCKVDSDEHYWICNGIITHNCTEIFLPDNDEESFVCDLSSMNIYHYDEWKDTDAVELLTYFLDAVMTEFIEKASKIPAMERAVQFAQRHRALGIGWLGWHSYLQKKMIPWESMEAKFTNIRVALDISNSSYAASEKLAKEYGEPEVLKGYGRRNTTLMAIAPTKSSAFILGQVSEGIEPHRANYYIKDLQKGKFTIKNKELESLLEEKGLNTEEIWESIKNNSGSVQHLKELTQEEKDVFKTFGEISPKEIVIQASQRQKYIDQGQSLNLMIDPSIPIKDVNALIIEGWRLGIKSFYYQIGKNAAQNFTKNILACKGCES
jgi:ribonucleotide reductase alpha subunit